MKDTLVLPALVAALTLAPLTAQAQNVDLTLGGQVGTDLIDGGESLTGGRPGAEIGLEAAVGLGFVGLAARTLRDGNDRSEVALSGGLRFELGAAEQEFGLARARADRSGSGDTGLFLGVEAELTPQFVLGPGAVHAPSPGDWNDLSALAAFDPTDRLMLSARLGRVPAERITYADPGLARALAASSGLDLRLHRAVLSLVTEFNLR